MAQTANGFTRMNDNFAELATDVQIELGDSNTSAGAINELDGSPAAGGHTDLASPRGGFSLNPKTWVEEWKREYEEFKADGWRLTEKRQVILRAIGGEFLCTLMFMYIVMAAGVNLIITNSTSQGQLTTQTGENFLVAAISTAFVSVALIYSFADVSGAHFNPAVTFATMITGKTSIRKGLGYIFVQMIAAWLASILLVSVYDDRAITTQSGNGIFDKMTVSNLLVVAPNARVSIGAAFVMEIILTFVLVYVIFATAFDTVDTKNAIKIADAQKTSDGKRVVDKSVGRNLTIYTTSGNTKAGFAPIAIGFTLGLLTFIGGSVSGGAFNPARVFGPALMTGNFDYHWLYWFGDFFGAALAGFAQRLFSHHPVQNSGGK